MTRTITPPLSLYVHVPWCLRKCPYCDFNSHEAKGALPEAAFVERALEDLDLERAGAQGRTIGTLFFGGGTPSLLDPSTVGALIDGIAARVGLDAHAEITLEANPGTAEAARFAGYRSAGVNRLSLGIQSFSDRALAALGRIHDGQDARRAVELARRAGFERVNLDLMHGLPGQTPADSLADLDTALSLTPEHLSWYQLTIEANTHFHSRPPQLPLEDVLERIETEGAARIADAGLVRYEVSAWARPGGECRHNLNYWTFGDYLGIGPGAHGKCSAVDATGGLTIERTRRTRAPADWLQRPARRIAERVPEASLGGEFMLNALRLIEGVDEATFEARTGRPLAHLEPMLSAQRSEGLLRADRLATTALGLRFLDRVTGAFLA
ncbi:MAG: radical SAM family heme chaperone HemW [Pseudomonadales bacterium]|nr:radical SAM family heme chaperone HemW [Pseudomonadales bacterium]